MSKKKSYPITDHVLDEIPEPVEVVEIPTTHTMTEGENIQTVAQIHLPEGWTRNEYANHLLKNNGSFAVGKVINLG